ncbi:ribosomal-processing cysteine protease Prp [Thermosediminibacter oceani]|uniref:Ribosomal processing cysteine protease Prp n=1 Tax=Thermosediminibacter oceani (strain ATCC BAA-1034 / DSM 16646 / JW/IW-1228P) TaxID=555079 RepID=D9S2A3_THEOJ|nr:ribosomal-processing cysteine protease Prp [Thermosediminibacter oceani]ADL07530.1 protein of unknown function DUF464 [Thermosediminibacter oceani DSM 16646]
MIKATVVLDARGRVRELLIRGHAGYAEYGKDIVCAAVSALAETAVLGIEEVAGVNVSPVKREGYFHLTIPEDESEDKLARVGIILDTIVIGLKDIAKTYPSHIKVETKRGGV